GSVSPIAVAAVGARTARLLIVRVVTAWTVAVTLMLSVATPAVRAFPEYAGAPLAPRATTPLAFVYEAKSAPFTVAHPPMRLFVRLDAANAAPFTCVRKVSGLAWFPLPAVPGIPVPVKF